MKLWDHFFFQRDLEMDYPVAAKGEGCWIWDENGNKYLDACAGANVTGIGHGVREIGEAMAEQAGQIAYVPGVHFFNRRSIELTEKLISLAPEGYSRVMLLSGGSEAIDNAFKIARMHHVLSGHPSKFRIISRWQGFHGNTLATDAVGGHTGRRSIYNPMFMPGVQHIVPACCYRCAFDKTYPDCGIICARDLERMIVQEGPDYICAFVTETIVGAAAGAVTPVSEYYPLIRQICDKYNVLWIADEIMSGVWRTGKFLAIEHWGVKPDLVVLAKGLSSGYAPLSAILVHDRVFESFKKSKTNYIGGHTYNAHAVTSKVGLTVLNYIEEHKLMEGVEEKGRLLSKGLQTIADKEHVVGDIRGMGLMWGLEFVRDKASKLPFDPDVRLARRLMMGGLENGIVIYPVSGCADGRAGDGILICPPLVINAEEIEFLVKKLGDTLGSVRSEI